MKCAGKLLAVGAAVATAAGCMGTSAEDSVDSVESDWTQEIFDSSTFWGATLIDDVLVVDGVAMSGDDESPALYAFDAADGDLLWSVAGDLQQQTWVTPDAVVTLTDDTTLTAYDLSTGAERFGYELPADRLGQSVAVTHQAAYVVEEHVSGESDEDQGRELVALDLENGEQLWSQDHDLDTLLSVFAPTEAPQVDGISFRHPDAAPRPWQAADSAEILVSFAERGDDSAAESTAVIDAESGDELWQLPEPVAMDAPPPRRFDDRILTQAPQAGDSCDVSLSAVDVAAQESVELTTHTSTYIGEGSWECGSQALGPQLAGDVVYGQDEDHRPQLIDSATGEDLWVADDAGMPVFYADQVAVYTPEGNPRGGQAESVAVDVDSGEELWRSDDMQLASNAMISDALATGAKAGTSAFDLRSGDEQWNHPDAMLTAQDGQRCVFVENFGANPDQLSVAACP